SGSKNDYWSGTRIAGAVAGVRGVKGNVGYDLFAGVPVIKPDDMQTSPFRSRRWLLRSADESESHDPGLPLRHPRHR
ncbi:hypothetical protein, partial [Citrobacter amalonaticus]|uniref:hypothetical protein n=1 Tax=Citrobacter amalonaticus TaxID=35703 RepID=UPI001E615858